jgi:hypothetical protein
MRVSLGLGIMAIFIGSDLLVLGSVSWFYRLALFVPFLIGFLAVLNGAMSFCIRGARTGTYDLAEPWGLPIGKSSSRTSIKPPEWKKKDQAKANAILLQAFAGALALALLLAFV